MDKAREALTVGEEDSRVLTELEVRPHRAGDDASFYEGFALRGLRVESISPGYLSCSFKVPPRLTVSNCYHRHRKPPSSFVFQPSYSSLS